MYLIDMHCHFYPEKVSQKATDSIRDFYEIYGGTMTGTAEMLLQRGREAGIAKHVVLAVATRLEQVSHINRFIADTTLGSDTFIGCGTVHAAMENPAEEVERILSMGLHGIKMHPDIQGFAIDDPRLMPMYEAIEGKLPLFFHMGDRRMDFSHPARLRRILDRFPRLQVSAAHFGGYTMPDTGYELLKDTNCVMDISSSMMFMQPGEAERYIRLFGAERLAFGTDYPLWDPVPETRRFLELKITDEEKEQIAHKTAQRFLGID